ncbi:MAG: hypothetical protein IPK52_22145 [Chloroflexi bacterium]|nr:hypothetical protein [Chloroflexota bacterium]
MSRNYSRFNIGDTVAYRIPADGTLTPAAVAKVTGISYELEPYAGRVTYRLSSGLSVGDDNVLSYRDAMAAGMVELHDLFQVMDEVGQRIAEMGDSDNV